TGARQTGRPNGSASRRHAPRHVTSRLGLPLLTREDGGVTGAPDPRDAVSARHVRRRSPIRDVVTDLLDDVTSARFPLDLPGAEALRELRDRVETQIGAHLLPRLKRDAGPAVVVLGGSTGAGKSTLVNSVVGREISDAGVIRPTTI